MRVFVQRLIAIAIAVLCQASLAHGASNETIVCHRPAIEGMEDQISLIHGVVGPDVKDKKGIRIHITQSDGRIFVQSNYLAVNIGTGEHVEYPTKVLWSRDEKPDLRRTIGNILIAQDEEHPGSIPADIEQQIRTAITNTEVTIDPEILGPDGRPPFDLTGVRKISLANDQKPIESGEVQLIRLTDPPPALMERLAGCCFNGRPPGSSGLITKRLEKQKISQDNTTLLSMVVDSGTSNKIQASPLLNRLERRAASSGGWAKRLDAAMVASKGKTLIILSHIVDGKVVVEDAAHKVLYSTPLETLQAMADQRGVNLILFGCETARHGQAQGLSIGVLGKYNTVFAAERVETALATSKNGREFMAAVATEGLTIVAQPGGWSRNGVAAAGYLTPKAPGGVFKRLFRVWFMGHG